MVLEPFVDLQTKNLFKLAFKNLFQTCWCLTIFTTSCGSKFQKLTTTFVKKHLILYKLMLCWLCKRSLSSITKGFSKQLYVSLSSSWLDWSYLASVFFSDWRAPQVSFSKAGTPSLWYFVLWLEPVLEMQRPEVLETWMDQGCINVHCLLLSAFPHDTQYFARVFLAVVHKDLSIMTAGFFSSSHLSAWCVCDWDYFSWDVLAYIYLYWNSFVIFLSTLSPAQCFWSSLPPWWH